MEATIGDLKELKRILANGSTPYVESLIKDEISKLEKKFVDAPKEESSPKPIPTTTTHAPKKSYETISSYAFSDSNDKATIIIRHIRGLEQAEVVFEPAERQCVIYVLREKMNMSDLKLTLSPLYKKIIPSESKYTKRNETLTISLAKKKKTSWMKLKKSAIDMKKPKSPQNDPKVKEDPNAALMDMMKKMYDEGDDEMKRTISKAMWEAQHKKPEEEKK
ncbi:calcyclin-binding protein-like [Histomonas meleagridis]|uniref:calcyclin-binding protein-like n=1 Tax=Histomonas meleagridis TaxID=135588 RepID=UPI0035596140|nr:calcyclin-binding protein-like [Histomonas meleagridis]KAH0806399.1 calcyclin-binding protein-like [Histomonas meleagridis]